MANLGILTDVTSTELEGLFTQVAAQGREQLVLVGPHPERPETWPEPLRGHQAYRTPSGISWLATRIAGLLHLRNLVPWCVGLNADPTRRSRRKDLPANSPRLRRSAVARTFRAAREGGSRKPQRMVGYRACVGRLTIR